MNFATGQCFDCPIPALPAIVGLLLGSAGILAGAAIRHRSSLERLTKAVVLGVSSLWSVLMAGSLMRYHVIWSWGWSRPDLASAWRINRIAELVLLVAWFGLSVLAVWTLRSGRRAVA